ncbi:hypothetical protein ARMSODRAFT_956285 [Armillaria solidipes]|uniref:Zn(2)-C6 fungal-type domain-containing protein n=1 Tax=Armillaria solidipes TaxID=1076256 RepID=A0A2H3BTA5_9AGAR|nr:hypothetical protein ARMSODRAFT_956285 [Armillaria solidipes]
MPEQHAHVLYTKLLLSRGHGYPLWTPEPDYSLCSAYVGRGICVGDVGIIRDDGGFDFIFNAFLEADDPVHEGGVPPNFSPLRTESPNPIRTIYFQHPRDSSVRSSHVSVKSLSLEASAEVPSIAGGGAGFEFTTSRDQAAVLILPQGGTRFDRKNLSSMRKYALEHAHEWYEYINSPNYLGREALNGSLCFVTGCDKTTAWGSAAMSKPSDTRQFSIKFLVGGLAEGRIALRSSWSTQEWTDTRIYPDQDIDMDAPLPVRENQGVFIRSFTISVREKSRITKILPGFKRPGGVQLVEVSGKSGNSPVIGSKAPYSDQRHDSPPGSAPVWKGNGDMICGSIVGNELMQLQISIINAHMKSFGESHQPESISDYPSMSSIPYGGMNTPVASQLSSDDQDHIVLQYFPERSTELLNPSVKFNEYILSTAPESDVVVTHDSAWMLPMLVADIFISGLSAPRFLMAGKHPSYVRSKRGRMKRTWYFKAHVRTSTPDLKEIKMSTSFLSFGYARFFSCLFMPLSPLQVNAELPDYIDRFPTVNTSELVLEFAKGASYIFREIPFSKESLQIQGARSSQVPQRPQFIHQDNLVMRYDGIGLVGCITEAGPVLRPSAPSTTAYNTSESIVVEINLLASPLTLYPVAMAPAPEVRESPSLSGSRGTSAYNTVDLLRTPSANQGGCWTCRLRRKKCDEQREGDSCRTCVLLTIECLGWGPKRPEWMRDKQAVEAYKANMKAKLTRAGLIRGQPRTSMLQAHEAKPAPTSRPPTFHRLPAPSPKTSEKSLSTASSPLALDDDLRPFDYRYDPPRMGDSSDIPGPSNDFHQLPAASYSDSNVNSMDFGAPMYQNTPQSSSVLSEPLDFDMGLYIAQHSNDQFDFNIRLPSPTQSFPLLPGQNSIQESHVMYFFEHVRKTNLPFSSNALMNLTYTMIVQEPRGAVTNAVCALSSLHFTRMRVAQGLEAPDPNPEHSAAQYFYDEATFQLASGKQAKSESDVLAALYLLYFSQMAGCTIDWRPMLAIAMEWITQTGLPTAENPKLLLANMSTSSQLTVKYTMWMDIFASFTLMKQPEYLALYKSLLDDQNGFWGRGLHMENLTGCPDEAMLALAEISGLARWKTSEQAKGSLNFRELVRRGDDIEQRLRNRQREPSNFGEQTPLHPNLMQTAMSDAGAISYPDEVMQLVGNVFQESALLYLHTIINEDNPAVPEIAASVNTITQLLHELEPSEIDRTLVFPVCLAGCMTSNSSHRDLLKSRLQSQDESIGNLLQTRLVMEAVWQKRGKSGSNACEWREILRERCPNLLLI